MFKYVFKKDLFQMNMNLVKKQALFYERAEHLGAARKETGMAEYYNCSKRLVAPFSHAFLPETLY